MSLNDFCRTACIPEEWGIAVLMTTFKKRDDCSNYQGTSLFNSTYQVYTKILYMVSQKDTYIQ